MNNFNKNIAIIHEWLVSYAGSEKCVESFVNIWNDADVYALVDFLNDEERKQILKGKKTKTSFIQKLPFTKKKHRSYLPFFPLAIEQLDLTKYNIILSSSHSVAKGVLVNSNQLHICYCHTPMRYAWDSYFQYLKEANLTNGLKELIVKLTLHYLRIWDLSTTNRVDYFIANSKYIAQRVKKIYNRDSEVIYPPVDIDKFECETKKDNYYLTASRFVPYKKVDVVVEAFSKMPDKKLIVIGDGPEEKRIKKIATKNIDFIPYLKQEELKTYFQKAKAFVFAAEEDFGITIVETLSCGTPVIAFNKGGTAETVIDGENGIHFNEQTPDAIIDAIKKFETNENHFDSIKISNGTEKFSRKNFEEKIKQFVDLKAEEFFNF